jgi:branched-chain amino acid aminotransferase
VKCLNYLDSVLARREASAAGADDAILLDLDGYVAEATGENVFIVTGDEVSTPTTSSALPGITRRVVIDQLVEQGRPVLERDIEPSELLTADEVFLTGTAAEIVPVGRVDGRAIGDGRPGAVTTAVADWYRGFATSYPGLEIAPTQAATNQSPMQ